MSDKIIYTETDEAPALATHSLLPIIRRFTSPARIEIEVKNISLAARILSVFPEFLNEDQRRSNDLEELGKLVQESSTNIIKLPNISASMPQLLEAINELQAKGYKIPHYPSNPKNEEEEHIKDKYDALKGSAVNPVLREGNSDRRAPQAVKAFAKKHPHFMGAWDAKSKSHVASMDKGDFKANEKSITFEKADKLNVVLEANNGDKIDLLHDIEILEGEIIDGTYLSKKELIRFLRKEKENAKRNQVLFSLHMKATMMKVSDPIIFGHAVRLFFEEVFNTYSETFNALDVNPNNGYASVLRKVETLEEPLRTEILQAFDKELEDGPDLAMVNSDLGITNLHVPSDIIIDASMPAMIRNSGQMWNKDGKPQDTKAIIPDSTYASIYQETVEFCKANGAFDPTTMGTVPNVGLMAQKAEEYGSHDKTFEIPKDGKVIVTDKNERVIMEHEVEAGDIWRMCQVKDAPIKNWIELAVNRAKATKWPTVFWLDKERAHDKELIKKVEKYLPPLLSEGIEIRVLSPAEATKFTLKRLKEGENTISVSGNVLRDFLTDLFPILELGTSAKMLSIVPLMNGGGLFETGAGGSAPKHVQQFVEENHLRWDSLGEFLALSVSLEHLANSRNNDKARVLSNCLEKATERLLENGKSPSRKVKEIDNRGSHFYLSLYWAEELSKQSEDKELASEFESLFNALSKQEEAIAEELINVQGDTVDLNGYYLPDVEKVDNAMRASKIFNEIMA